MLKSFGDMPVSRLEELSAQLHEEIAREHEAMRAKMESVHKETAPKESAEGTSSPPTP